MAFYETHDPRFGSYVMGNAPVKQLATGFDWVEGPVWFCDAGCLLFSDIPNNRIQRYTPGVGISTYRAPSHYSNSHTRDLLGRLISCEHGTRRMTRTELDSAITVIVDKYQGKPLNLTNDIVDHSDVTIWFTDPHHGILTNCEGFQSSQELPCHVYRADPDGTIQAVLTDFSCPNGVAFSPDKQTFYVSDTGPMFLTDPQHIRSFSMASGRPVGGAVFHTVTPGCADGIGCDSDGNLWAAAADGVHCVAPDGQLMGKILIPEVESNPCLGGRAKHQLFIIATTSLYAITLNRAGVQMP